MTRETLDFWTRDMGLLIAVAGFAWEIRPNGWLCIWAALTVWHLADRLGRR